MPNFSQLPPISDAAAYDAGKRVSRLVISRAVHTVAPTLEELAILKAVRYASLFDYPLTGDELGHTLIGARLTVARVREVYRRSRFLQARITHEDGLYRPVDRPGLVAQRHRREACSRALLQSHAGTLRMLCAVPFTRLVALSGSLAHLNAEADGDLDLFVVTRGGRVWTVAVAMVVLAKLLGRRRVVCVNYVIADSRLALDEQDLFSANQVIHLRPIIGHDVYRDFVDANPFVRRWFPNATLLAPASAAPVRVASLAQGIKRGLEWVCWWPSAVIEYVCRWAYGWHLRRRLAACPSPEQVRLEADCLKLHSHSHRVEVLQRFDRLMAD